MATLNDRAHGTAFGIEQLGPGVRVHVFTPARFIIDGKRADQKVRFVRAAEMMSH